MKRFSLREFSGQDAGFGLSVDVVVGREGVRLEYRVEGEPSRLALPPLRSTPRRLDRLWEQTCFEAFWGPVGQPTYWEMNLSPSGDWNVYAFDGYRTGMRQETAVQCLNGFSREESDSTITLRVDLPLVNSDASKRWELAMTAILLTAGGERTFWALRHPEEKPDFHQRSGFEIKI